MTDDRAIGDGPGTDVMAAELALGLLEGDDRAAALRRQLSDPDFAREVERWRDHFATLFDASPEIAAPAGGFERIERALSPVANDDALPRATTGPWRGIAIGSSLIAAALLGVIALRPGVAPTPVAPPEMASVKAPILVATIAPVGKGAAVPAVYDPNTGDLRIAMASLGQSGHSAELWVIPKDGVPVSIGLLEDNRAKLLAISPAHRAHFAAGSTLAVTIEPIGGAPDGKPTGPVVASGALTLV